MKRISSSDSSGALMSMCPTTEEQSPTRNNHVYSREFQSMLEGLDEEGCIEESNQVSEKKRRLSVEQVKALEKNFEVENKLEPDRKVKLAQELGLQTRQVAVWFQNRRARWKTKQLERDYGVLKASYDDLKHNFDKVQHDNEALLKEIRGLKSKLQEENSVESNVSAKEEAMVSESENKVVEEMEEQQNHQIKTPPLCSSVAKCDDISEMNCGGLGFTNTIKDGSVVVGLGTTAASSSIFPDLKDGSSDSDSSAILNEDTSPHGAAISSTGTELLLSNGGHHHHHYPFMMSSSSSQSSMNCSLQISLDSSKSILCDAQKAYQPSFVKIEEHNFFCDDESCNFFSDDQAPALHWYCPDQWT